MVKGEMWVIWHKDSLTQVRHEPIYRVSSNTRTNPMKITVQIRSVYGNETIYPACKQSVLFCGLARTKTITQEMMRMIVAAGYEVEVEAPKLRFAA